MSASGRFAPMTAQLLARKGEASPADHVAQGSMTMDRRDVVVRGFDSPNLAPRVHGVSELASPNVGPRVHVGELSRFSGSSPEQRRRHSIGFSVTDTEFEMLGLAAVKKRINRQQLLRLAVDHYLEKLELEYRSDCRCISKSAACCKDTGD